MKKILTSLALTAFIYVNASAQLFSPGHHIIVYSTHPVDTTYARPHNNARALIRSAGDTLISYINRAKYTLDIALYDFVEDSLWYEGGYVPPIHIAINNAYKRGVKIRWIHNPSDTSKYGGGSNAFANAITPNYGLDSINPAIPMLARTDLAGIMHNKFVVVDGRASNPNDAIVWTGCMNWEPGQIDKDINNIIIFQDSALAHCYLMEFNQMWGDTVEGGVPNSTKALFGSNKKNITPHNFVIDGYKVESYFSPSDNTSSHIVSTENAAQSEIDFEMFTFTFASDDSPIKSAISRGVKVYGIMDQSSLAYTPYSDLSGPMGVNLLVYTGLPGYDYNSICHSKYMVVDPCNLEADPMVLTGSHNWSSSANTVNDENTVIVHDSSVANQYYQAFHADFYAVSGGTSLKQTCYRDSTAGINEVKNFDQVSYYPNPATSELKVTLNIPGNNVLYSVYNVTGEMLLSGRLDARYVNTININTLPSGMYLLRVQNSNTKEFTGKFIKH
ncbi:MAG TPA: phospholipase D-like domain-containing protein [Bacteroidia bacterium]|jgi:phosphatidylserine/phosphatidylglycerophosphate/cardiolipin synthase-like enzyme|nr:phospholipase D-like domain-containing protein [Bacteroidia bacterium]